MKVKLKTSDYALVAKHLLIFGCFLVFNCVEKDVVPYSLAILATAFIEGCSLIVTPILFILSFVVLGKSGLVLSMSIAAAVLVIIMLIYKRFDNNPKFEVCAYVALSLSAYILIGDTASQIRIEKRALTSAITIALSFFCLLAGKAIAKKGLKFKMGFEESVSIAMLVAVLGIGLSNLTTPLIWKSLSIFIILMVCFIYRTGFATITSAVLGISLAVYYSDINYVSVYLALAIVTELLTPLSRHVAAIALMGADYLLDSLFRVYGGYSLTEFLPIFIGAVIFCIIPTKLLSELKEQLYSFREKQLVRQSINRNRIMLSGRLYDLSGVFGEMAGAFNLFNDKMPSEQKIKEQMQEQLFSSVCSSCEHFARCAKYQSTLKIGITKLVDVGFAKGKLSLIDLPKEVGDACFHPNDVIFFINKLLADYRAAMVERMNVKTGRDLLASEALGVAEILRGLALETGTLVKYHTRLERTLSNALFKKGFLVEELLIFGEEELISVGLVLVMKEFSINRITATVSKVIGADMMLFEQVEISEDKCYLSFRRSPPLDAVFGLARAVKDGSPASGDTHAVARITDNRFLAALSDGMGSGEAAQEISSASLSLIESFYKAGLKSSLILNTVNRLLSINTEDSFAALDVAVVNLFDCSADFIKYGSPYGFIIGKGGVKIVEGDSLPLGIIDDLKPTVCQTQLSPGDMVVLLTDGISDAFGSSSEMIDFLHTLPAKNPQTFAEKILNRALELSGGKKNDDMTVLAVRIFKRKTNIIK